MRKNTLIQTTGALSLLFAAFIFYIFLLADDVSTNKHLLKPTQAPALDKTTPVDTQNRSTSVISTRDTSPQSHARQMSLEYETTQDLLLFIESVRASAELGDGLASWYISKALDECFIISLYPETQTRFLLDRAEQFEPTAARHLAIKLIEERSNRCHSFSSRTPVSFEEKLSWMTRAASDGYLAAQLALAQLALTGQFPNIQTSRAGVLNLVQQTLTSGDAEAFYELAKIMGSSVDGYTELSPRYSGSDYHTTLWTLVACDRGYNCGPSGEYLKNLCQSDGLCQYISLDQYFFEQVLSPAEASRISMLRSEINHMLTIRDHTGVFSNG